MARIRMAISMEIPEGATRQDCLDYAVDAVASWKGSLHPVYDPMFDLDGDTVSGTTVVTRQNKRIILRSE